MTDGAGRPDDPTSGGRGSFPTYAASMDSKVYGHKNVPELGAAGRMSVAIVLRPIHLHACVRATLHTPPFYCASPAGGGGQPHDQVEMRFLRCLVPLRLRLSSADRLDLWPKSMPTHARVLAG